MESGLSFQRKSVNGNASLFHPQSHLRNPVESPENKENVFRHASTARHAANAMPVEDFFFSDNDMSSANAHAHMRLSGAPAQFRPASAHSQLAPRTMALQPAQQNPPEPAQPQSYCDATADISVAFDGTQLVPVKSLLPHHVDVFRKYKFFNVVQSRCFSTVYNSDDNVVVAAPTGCGKTAIFELAVLRTFRSCFGAGRANGAPTGKTKAIYICPLKALCEERYADWTEKFTQLGLRVAQVTGDTQHVDFGGLSGVDIIITTPEKWDTMTRRWNASASSASMMNAIGLLMVDEVHVLNEARGACVEGTVTRCKMVKSTYASAVAELRSQFEGEELRHRLQQLPPIATMRLIALSATVPNLGDIAEWLDAKSFSFGPQYRPVPLEVIVKPYPPAKSAFMFSHILNFRLADIIFDHSGGRPALVFCATRKECMSAAQEIVKQGAARPGRSAFVTSARQRQALDTVARTLKNKQLADCIVQGVGVHTAGLEYSDRQAIERLFIDGHLLVLCTTSTLAQGVNLPAHLVVIKGTQAYNTGTGYEEYAGSAVVQMMGRAGRPQFDTSAKCVIMTQQATRRLYDSIEQTPIESTLTSAVIEHLNAEIVLGTVRTPEDAHRWIRNTYLYVRTKRKAASTKDQAALRQITEASKAIHASVNAELERLCSSGLVQRRAPAALTAGAEAGESIVAAASSSASTSAALESTMLGQMMARYYLRFETAASFARLSSAASLEDVIDLCAGANEYQGMQIKMGEKTALTKLNRVPKKELTQGGFPGIRFPVRRSAGSSGSGSVIAEAKDKVKVLLQCALDPTCRIMDHELNMAAETIAQGASRLLASLTEYLATQEASFAALKHALLLKKGLAQRLWPDPEPLEATAPGGAPAARGGSVSVAHVTDHLLQQLEGIGPKYCSLLGQRGIKSFGDLAATTAMEVDAICGRGRAFSQKIFDSLQAIPQLVVGLEVEPGAANQAPTGTHDRRVRVMLRQLKDDFKPVAKLRQCVTLIVGDTMTNRVLFHRSCWLSGSGEQEWSYQFTARAGSTVSAVAVDKTFVGVDVFHSVSVPGTRPVEDTAAAAPASVAAPATAGSRTGVSASAKATAAAPAGADERSSDAAAAPAGPAKLTGVSTAEAAPTAGMTRQEISHARAKALLEQTRARKSAEQTGAAASGTRGIQPKASSVAIAAAASAVVAAVGSATAPRAVPAAAPTAPIEAVVDDTLSDLDGLGEAISDLDDTISEVLATRAAQEKDERTPVAGAAADAVVDEPPLDELGSYLRALEPRSAAEAAASASVSASACEHATEQAPAAAQSDAVEAVAAAAATGAPVKARGGLYKRGPDGPSPAPASGMKRSRAAGSAGSVHEPVLFAPAAPGSSGPLSQYLINGEEAPAPRMESLASLPLAAAREGRAQIYARREPPRAPAAGRELGALDRFAEPAVQPGWAAPQTAQADPPAQNAAGGGADAAVMAPGAAAFAPPEQPRQTYGERVTTGSGGLGYLRMLQTRSATAALTPDAWGQDAAAESLQPFVAADSSRCVPPGAGRGALTGAEAAAAWQQRQAAGAERDQKPNAVPMYEHAGYQPLQYQQQQQHQQQQQTTHGFGKYGRPQQPRHVPGYVPLTPSAGNPGGFSHGGFGSTRPFSAAPSPVDSTAARFQQFVDNSQGHGFGAGVAAGSDDAHHFAPPQQHYGAPHSTPSGRLQRPDFGQQQQQQHNSYRYLGSGGTAYGVAGARAMPPPTPSFFQTRQLQPTEHSSFSAGGYTPHHYQRQ